jgi:hypothetical protein
MMKSRFPNEVVELMVIANEIPKERRLACEQYNIEPREISVKRFRDIANEVNYIFRSEISSQKEPIEEVSRTVRTSAANTELTDTKKLQVEYWTAFKKYMDENRSVVRCPLPYHQNFTNFAIGRSNFGLCARMIKTEIGVFIYINGPNRTAFYKLLEQEYKNQIESELNYELIWRTRQKNGYIGTSREADTLDKDKWIEQHQWLKETLEKFRKVLSPIINKLDATDYHEAKE